MRVPLQNWGDPDDVISPRWRWKMEQSYCLNMTDSPLIIDATGSSEVFSGSTDTNRTMEKGSEKSGFHRQQVCVTNLLFYDSGFNDIP